MIELIMFGVFPFNIFKPCHFQNYKLIMQFFNQFLWDT